MSFTRNAMAVSAVLAALLARNASAAPDTTQVNRERAREHYTRALAHLRSNELERALAELMSAYELHPHYAVLYNIGKIHAALGDPVRALQYLDRYLADGGKEIPAVRREEVERLIAEQSPRVARLTLAVVPEAAVIKIDGAEVGTSPLERPLVVLAGRRELSIERAGYRSERRSLELGGGSEQTIRIELTRVPRAPDATGSATVDIDCPIPDVILRVDGHPQARTPVTSIVVPVGMHDISFERPGYRPSRQVVVARAESTVLIRCSLRAAQPLDAAHSGRIETGLSRPHTLRIDGAPAPFDGRVPRGRHRVELSKAGFRPWSEDVLVASGATLRLSPELEPTDETLRARQTQRTWAYALGINGGGLLLASGLLFLWNDLRHSDWQRRQTELDGKWARPPPRDEDLPVLQVENDELFESIAAFDRVTVGLGVTGGALVVGGVVLYVLGEDPEKRSRPALALSSDAFSAGWDVSW